MQADACPLRSAMAHGDLQKVQQQLQKVQQQLLPREALHSRAGSWGRTVLHEAVWSNQIEIVQQLLSAGAWVHRTDAQDWTALHLAAVRGLPDIALVLLQHGAEPLP